MKKLTLLVAAITLAGFTFAQDGGKPCCKKGAKCSKSCSKDSKKSDSKASGSASGEKKSAPAPKS